MKSETQIPQHPINLPIADSNKKSIQRIDKYRTKSVVKSSKNSFPLRELASQIDDMVDRINLAPGVLSVRIGDKIKENEHKIDSLGMTIHDYKSMKEDIEYSRNFLSTFLSPSSRLPAISNSKSHREFKPNQLTQSIVPLTN